MGELLALYLLFPLVGTPPTHFLKNKTACPPAPVALSRSTTRLCAQPREITPLGASGGSRETAMDSSDGELLFLRLFPPCMTESIADLRSRCLAATGCLLSSSREIIVVVCLLVWARTLALRSNASEVCRGLLLPLGPVGWHLPVVPGMLALLIVYSCPCTHTRRGAARAHRWVASIQRDLPRSSHRLAAIFQ